MDDITAHRFPLIARPRPACTPLAERVAALHTLAATAITTNNLADATYVFNQAALIASDCGAHDLAQQWCHRLARVALASRHPGRYALEPVVNLARLRIRAGDGATAWTMLETLYQAVTDRTTVTIDGITITAANLTDTPETHRELREWAWKVLLGTGGHALASADRWDEARHRLTRHRGIGGRMLDGRQIAVISHARAGRADQADAMLRDTIPGQPWENAVTGCLTLLCTPARQTDDAHIAYYEQAPEPGLAVFWTRLGLSLIDALGPEQPHARALTSRLLSHARDDGYAARDVLAHPGCRRTATGEQTRQLRDVVGACGLDQGNLHADYTAQLTALFEEVEPMIRCGSSHQAVIRA
jgi:hypothetical protein